MKSITNRLFLFAATAVFFGTTAFGQNPMKASIPFAFSIQGGAAAAGDYVINLDTQSSGKVVRLYNVDTHHAAVTLTVAAGGGIAEHIQPRLVFRCGDEGCALSEVWTANGGYALPQRKIRAHEYLASIPLTVNHGN
jgi:hypothetical protein